MAHLYWNKTGANAHWNTVTGNWWTDAAHTVQAGAIPQANDYVHIDGATAPDTAPTAITLSGYDTTNYIGVSGSGKTSSITIAAGGTLIIGGMSSSYWWQGDATSNAGVVMTVGAGGLVGSPAPNGAVFNSTGVHASAGSGNNIVFNGSSVNSGAGVLGTGAVFNDSSSSCGTVGAGAIFNSTAAQYGTFGATATLERDTIFGGNLGNLNFNAAGSGTTTIDLQGHTATIYLGSKTMTGKPACVDSTALGTVPVITLSEAVQDAMTGQGYTSARGPKLDNLDAAVSSRAVPGDKMDLVAILGRAVSGSAGLASPPTCVRNSPAVAAATDGQTMTDMAVNVPRTCQISVVDQINVPIPYLAGCPWGFDVTPDGKYLYWGLSPHLVKRRDATGVDTTLVDITVTEPMKTFHLAGSAVTVQGIWCLGDGSLLLTLWDANFTVYDGVHSFMQIFRCADPLGAPETWTLVHSDLDGYIPADYLLSRSGSRIAYADYADPPSTTCGHGVKLSTDYGQTWVTIFTRWPTLDTTWNTPHPACHNHTCQFAHDDPSKIYLVTGESHYRIITLVEPANWNGTDPWTPTVLADEYDSPQTRPFPAPANEGCGETSFGFFYASALGHMLIAPDDLSYKPCLGVPSSYLAAGNWAHTYGYDAGCVRGMAEIGGILFAGMYAYILPDTSLNMGLYASADGGASWVAIWRDPGAKGPGTPYRVWQGNLLWSDAEFSRIVRIPFPTVRLADAVQVEKGLTNKITLPEDSTFTTAAGAPSIGNWSHFWTGGSLEGVAGGLHGPHCLKFTIPAAVDSCFCGLPIAALAGQPAIGDCVTFRMRFKCGPGWPVNYNIIPKIYSSGGGSLTYFELRFLPGNDGWMDCVVQGKAGATPSLAQLGLVIDNGGVGGQAVGDLYIDAVQVTYDAASWIEGSFQPAGTVRADEYVSYPIPPSSQPWRMRWHWRPEWGTTAVGAGEDIAIGHVRADDGTYVEVTWQQSSGKFILSDGVDTAESTAVAWRHWDDVQFDLYSDGVCSILTLTEPVGGEQVVNGSDIAAMSMPTELRLGVNGAGTMFGCGRFALDAQNPLDALVAAVQAIKSQTDQNLDAAISTRAVPGDKMDLVDAPNALAVAAVRDVALAGAAAGSLGEGVATTQTKLSGITSLRDWLRGLFRKDAMNAAAKAEVNAIHDGGAAGTFDEATDSGQGLADSVADIPTTGDGDVAVNHNYGGTDALRVLSGGVPVDGAVIRAYLKTAYDAGTYTVVARAVTGSDGRWVAPMMLDADTYVLITSGTGKVAKKTEVTVA